MKLFIDTGPLVAVVCKHDQYHKRARDVWEVILAYDCVTTNLVLVESVNLLARNIGGREAVMWARKMFLDKWIELIDTNLKDHETALPVVERMSWAKVGLADAVSFLVMDRLDIQNVATFDGHFEKAGFKNVCK